MGLVQSFADLSGRGGSKDELVCVVCPAGRAARNDECHACTEGGDWPSWPNEFRTECDSDLLMSDRGKTSGVFTESLARISCVDLDLMIQRCGSI